MAFNDPAIYGPKIFVPFVRSTSEQIEFTALMSLVSGKVNERARDFIPEDTIYSPELQAKYMEARQKEGKIQSNEFHSRRGHG